MVDFICKECGILEEHHDFALDHCLIANEATLLVKLRDHVIFRMKDTAGRDAERMRVELTLMKKTGTSESFEHWDKMRLVNEYLLQRALQINL